MNKDFIESSIFGEPGPDKIYRFNKSDWEKTAILLTKAHTLLICVARGGTDARGIPVFIEEDSKEFIKEYDKEFLK